MIKRGTGWSIPCDNRRTYLGNAGSSLFPMYMMCEKKIYICFLWKKKKKKISVPRFFENVVSFFGPRVCFSFSLMVRRNVTVNTYYINISDSHCDQVVNTKSRDHEYSSDLYMSINNMKITQEWRNLTKDWKKNETCPMHMCVQEHNMGNVLWIKSSLVSSFLCVRRPVQKCGTSFTVARSAQESKFRRRRCGQFLCRRRARHGARACSVAWPLPASKEQTYENSARTSRSDLYHSWSKTGNRHCLLAVWDLSRTRDRACTCVALDVVVVGLCFVQCLMWIVWWSGVVLRPGSPYSRKGHL